jgi:beta-lactam-binding protein with PASTA domain
MKEVGLRLEISDSVYSEDIKKGAITEQDPRPGDKVKPNRIIYVVLNGLDKPKVKMPMLVDQSLTLAKAILKSNGLVLGTVKFIPDDIGNNLVLTQSIDGHDVPAGKMIEKGTQVDLVVAQNAGVEEVSDSASVEEKKPSVEKNSSRKKEAEPTKTEKKKKKRSREKQ